MPVVVQKIVIVAVRLLPASQVLLLPLRSASPKAMALMWAVCPVIGLLALIGGVVWTIVSPARGPQDRLPRTVVVPF